MSVDQKASEQDVEDLLAEVIRESNAMTEGDLNDWATEELVVKMRILADKIDKEFVIPSGLGHKRQRSEPAKAAQLVNDMKYVVVYNCEDGSSEGVEVFSNPYDAQKLIDRLVRGHGRHMEASDIKIFKGIRLQASLSWAVPVFKFEDKTIG